jgi:hypothetical protein
VMADPASGPYPAGAPDIAVAGGLQAAVRMDRGTQPLKAGRRNALSVRMVPAARVVGRSAPLMLAVVLPVGKSSYMRTPFPPVNADFFGGPDGFDLDALTFRRRRHYSHALSERQPSLLGGLAYAERAGQLRQSLGAGLHRRGSSRRRLTPPR